MYQSILRKASQPSGYRTDPFRWVYADTVGSKNACDRLVEKGWIEMDVEYGPRGGEHRKYRPVTEEEG